MKNIIKNFMATLNFYRFNPHSIPIISKICCKLGRHDYEVKQTLGENYAELECFYCLHLKRSHTNREKQ